MSVHILLVDDHPIVRQGLRTLLQAEAGFAVVGEASDGVEALKLIERHKPEVLVVDLMKVKRREWVLALSGAAMGVASVLMIDRFPW